MTSLRHSDSSSGKPFFDKILDINYEEKAFLDFKTKNTKGLSQKFHATQNDIGILAYAPISQYRFEQPNAMSLSIFPKQTNAANGVFSDVEIE
jgi:hypothetical protein